MLPDVAENSLVKSGNASAHGVSVRSKKGRLVVKSFTVANGGANEQNREMRRVRSIDTGTNFEIAFFDAENAAKFGRLAQRSGETLEYFRRRLFGEESVTLNAEIILVSPAAFGRYAYESTVAGDAAALRFLFKSDGLSIAGDDALSWFAPLETVMHETYHAQVAFDRIKRSRGDGRSRDLRTEIMEEAAAIVIEKCSGLYAFGKTTLAQKINIDLNNGARLGTLSDEQLRALLSDDFQAEQKYAYYLGVMLFNTIWAEFFGAKGNITAADEGADGFQKLCSKQYIGRPEYLEKLINQMAGDESDAPEFPQAFERPSNSWRTYARVES